MQPANLPPDISRLYEDLADRILASDEEGASRIYLELLGAGRALGILAEATRIPVIRKTIDPELFERGAANEEAPKIPDELPQLGSAQPEFARQSIVERAVQRLDWTVAPQMLPKTPRGLDHIANEQPQLDPPDVSRASRLRFGRRAGGTRLRLSSRLCLVSLLIAALAGTGIFLLALPSADKDVAESTPAEEVPEKTGEGTRSITAPAVRPPATGVVQSAALARPAATAASAPAAKESEANSTFGSPPSIARPREPAPNTTPTPANPTPGATSTASTPGPPSPPPELGFSAIEIAALLARGDASLATGDVASARLFYERAADSGEARAAVRLGETFDPVFVGRGHLRRVSGDLGMALFWYRRARDLGATDVERRLKTLETNREANNP